jgi:hypothetical protein
MSVGTPMAVGEAQQGLQTVVPPHPARVAPPWLLQRVRVPCHMQSWMSSRLGCVADTPHRAERFGTQSDKQAFLVPLASPPSLPCSPSAGCPVLGAGAAVGRAVSWLLSALSPGAGAGDATPQAAAGTPAPAPASDQPAGVASASDVASSSTIMEAPTDGDPPSAGADGGGSGGGGGNVNVNVNELRLGFSNTTRNPEGILMVVVVVVVPLGPLSWTQKGVAVRVSPPPQVLVPPLPAPQPPPLL